METTIPAHEEALLNFDGWLQSQPQQTRDGIAEHLALLPDEGSARNERAKLASMFAVSHATGLDSGAVSSRWDEVRAGYAEKMGWNDAKSDDAVFNAKMTETARTGRAERNLLFGPDDAGAMDAQAVREASLAWKAQEAAYAGKTFADALGEWQQASGTKPGFLEQRAPFYEDIARKTHEAVAAAMDKARMPAEQAFNAISNARGVTQGEGDIAPIQFLRGLTPQEQDVAFRLMGDMAGSGGDKGKAQAFFERVGRSFENQVQGYGAGFALDTLLKKQFKAGDIVTEKDALTEALANKSPEVAQQLGGGGEGALFGRLMQKQSKGRALTQEEADKWNADLASQVEDVKIAQRLRKFGQEVIDPAKAGGAFFQKWVLPTADSAAVITSLTVPGAKGWALETNAKAYQADEFQRLTDAGMDDKQANKLAEVTGAAQSALDLAGVEVLAKGFPKVTAVLKEFSMTGNAAKRFLVNAGGTLVAETAIELVQDHVIPALVQDNLANDPRFDVHWGDVWGEVAQTAPETAMGMVLLSALGGAHQTRQQGREAKAVRDYTASAAAMRANGYTMEQIAEIQAAPISQRADLLDAYAVTVAPTGDAQKQLVADVRELAAKEGLTFKEQASNEVAATNAAADYAVSVTRSKTGWWVTQADGVSVQASSAEAARRIREDLRQAGSQKEAEAFVALADNWHAKAPEGTTRETVVTGELARSKGDSIIYTKNGEVTREIKDSATLDTLREQAALEAKQGGNEEINVIVNGTNAVAFREKVDGAAREIVQRLEINQSASAALTFLHESLEADFRAGIASGALSNQEVSRAVFSIAPAFRVENAKTAEDRAFAERVQKVASGKASETEIRETISELAVADFIGRRRDGSRVQAGSITTALDAAIRESTDAATVKQIGKLRAFLRAAKQFFRGVLGVAKKLRDASKGGIGQEWESFIHKLTGMDEQKMHENAVADAVDQYIPPTAEEQANGIAFSLTRAEASLFARLASQYETKEQFLASIPSLPPSRENNRIDSPHRGEWMPGGFYKDGYGENQYIYAARDIDPRMFGELLKLEGMNYADVVNMPTTQKYIEWHKAGEVPPPITAIKRSEGVENAGRYVNSDRRRVVSAIEAGVKTIPAFVEVGRMNELWAQARSEVSAGEAMGVAFSLSPFKPLPGFVKQYNERLDEWEKTGDAGRAQIPLGPTPPALRVAGADAHLVVMKPGLLDKVTEGVHAVPVEALRALPESLADPVAVFQSRTHADSIVVLTEFQEGKKLVIAAITLDKKTDRNLVVNEVASLYGKPADVIAKMFEEGALYANQEKRLSLARRAGLQLPGRGTPMKGGANIPGPAEVVKWVEQQKTFSLSAGSRIESVQNRMDNALARDPEKRRELARKARVKLQQMQYDMERERLTPSGDTIRPLVEKRTPRSLDKEGAFREASRREELENEGMAALDKNTLQAYYTGVDALENDPFVFEMLNDHGKLISRSTAERRGWDLAEWDGATWLPPKWYSTNGETPDVMANNMRLETASQLFEKLGSIIEAQRKRVADFKKASDAVKAVQKQARNQAHEETAMWREDQDAMQAKDYAPRARLLRDLRTLDAITSVLPAELRGKVGGMIKIAALSTDKARLEEIGRRIEKISDLVETHLKAESVTALEDLIQRAQPHGGGGERPGGKITVEGHRFFRELERVRGLSEQQVEAESSALEKAIETAAEDSKPGEVNRALIDLLEKQQILDTFGNFEGKDAAEADAAVQRASEVYWTGRNTWRAVEEQRAEQTAKMQTEVIEAMGEGAASLSNRQAKKKSSKLLKKMLANGSLDLLTFVQVLEHTLGPRHALVKRWNNAARNAGALKTDAILAANERFNNALREAAGTKSLLEARKMLWKIGDEQTIAIDKREGGTSETAFAPVEKITAWRDGKADPSALGFSKAEADDLIAQLDLPENARKKKLGVERVNAGTVTPAMLTEAEAIALTMLAGQSQYAANLERHGYSAEALAQAEAGISDAGKRLRDFFSDYYRDGYEPIASLFREMFGIDLPRIEGYSPASFIHQGQERELDPFGGGLLTDGGFRSGFLKERKSHLAEPRIDNAFSIWQGHVAQTEHWKAFAPFVRELRGVLGNAEVKKAIEGAHGSDTVNALQRWTQAFEQNGLAARSMGRVVDGVAREVSRRQATLTLAWKAGTILKQSLAAISSGARLPFGAWSRGFVRVLSGKVDVKAIRESAMIQRRIESGYSVEVRNAMASLFSGKPSVWKDFVAKGMDLIGEADAFFTAIGTAIAYDHHYNEALKGGLDEAQAKAMALTEAEDNIARTAQPAEMQGRSLYELAMSPGERLLFMFASNQRKDTGLIISAFQQYKAGKTTKAQMLQTLSVAWLLSGLGSALIGAAWRDAKDDDDDSLFDAEHWSPWDLFKSTLLGPLGGIPLLGLAANSVLGFHGPDPFAPVSRALKAGEGIMDGDKAEPVEKSLRRVVDVANGAAMLWGGAEAVAVGANIFEQAFNLVDNFTPDTESEAVKKERKAANKERKAAQ